MIKYFGYILIMIVFSSLYGMESTTTSKNELLFKAIKEWDFVTALDIAQTEGVDLNARDCEGFTPLGRAVQTGDLGMIKLLINHGAPLNELDNHGTTALYYATNAYPMNTALVQFLIERGAIAFHNSGIRELSDALQNSNFPITRETLTEEANHYYINSRLLAVQSENLVIIRLFDCKGELINADHQEIDPPSTTENKLETIKWLVEHGANIIRTQNSSQVRSEQAGKKHLEVLNFLRGLGFNFPTNFSHMTLELEDVWSNPSELKKFLEYNDLQRALLEAAQRGDALHFARIYEEAYAILMPGRLPDVLEEPLASAALKGYENIVTFILDRAFVDFTCPHIILRSARIGVNKLLAGKARYINFKGDLIRNTNKITHQERENLTRISENLANAARLQQAATIREGRSRTQDAVQALQEFFNNHLFNNLPQEVIVLIFSFVVRSALPKPN